jgi:hypothetical protein
MDRPAASATRTASSHGFGLDDAIAVAAAVDTVAAAILDDIVSLPAAT